MADIKPWMNEVNKINALTKVNAQQAEVLRRQEEYAAATDTSGSSYEEMRASYNEERKQWNVGGPTMVESIDFTVPTKYGEAKARMLKPTADKKLPVVFYIHGGGFVLGNNDTHGIVQRKLAAYAGCAVCGIDYTLSPEAVYPQAIEETVAIYKYVVENADKFDIDPDRTAFAGDSGGANMSMGATMYLRDNGYDISKIKAEILFYGAFGLKTSRGFGLHGGTWDGMREEDMNFYTSMYLGDIQVEDAPYFNVYLNDLTKDVPPCFIVAAELDPLNDDSRLLYEILQDKGIKSEFVEYKGVLHAFVIYSNIMDDAEDAIKRGARFLANEIGTSATV